MKAQNRGDNDLSFFVPNAVRVLGVCTSAAKHAHSLFQTFPLRSEARGAKPPELTYLLLVVRGSEMANTRRFELFAGGSFRRGAVDKKLIESHHGIPLWQISDGN